MTQSSLQTQCPKCETRFRVTDAQLSVANGKVRCGNCMSVFNAIEHKIQESPASAPPAKPDTAPGPDATQDSEEDFVFADNPEEDAAESTYTGTRLTFSDDELSDSFKSVDESSRKSGFVTDEDEDTDESVDESWAEAILSEDERPAKAPQQPAQEPEAETPAEPKEQQAKKPTEQPQEPLEAPKQAGDSASQEAEWQLEGEPEPETRQPTPAQKPQQATKAPEAEAPAEDDYDGFFIDEPESGGFDYDFDEPEDRPEPGPRVAESPYQNLRREPIGVSSGGGKLRGFLWFLVVIALLGGLVSQVIYFQFDRLSAIPELRPFYEKGCDMFGCELKPLIDVESIQSRKLVVKTNPDDRSQLIVDAVIINRASFEQPFPAIALTFANLNNDVVAQSVFTPDEYLAGDGKDLEAMPTDTPVRIVINIRDPGKDAVNYNIAFRAHAP